MLELQHYKIMSIEYVLQNVIILYDALNGRTDVPVFIIELLYFSQGT